MMAYEEQAVLTGQQDAAQTERVPLQTIRRSFASILVGEDPWLPLGNFMHQFFGMYSHRQADLLYDPIEVPESVQPEQFKWAVFCAASVDYLCQKYHIPCPEWALDPWYTLAEPWYYAIGTNLLRVQEKLRQTTPDAFAKRNVFCGDRVYSNKYEYTGRQERRRPA